MSTFGRARRSRIAHFKTPFIVGVASTAALGAGCGGKTGDPERTGVAPVVSGGCDEPAPNLDDDGCGSTASCVDGEWRVIQSSCNPPFVDAVCPSAAPSAGTSCAGMQPGLTCDYEYCGGLQPMYRCGESSGVWEELPLSSCNPPRFLDYCPNEIPTPGLDCDPEGLFCGYPGCEGPGTSTAECRFGQWDVYYSIGAACNPPAVIPVCPERQPLVSSGCVYDGQACRYGVCGDPIDPGTVLTCAFGIWQQLEPPCPPPSFADAGPPDAG